MKQSHVPSTGAGKQAESKIMKTARAVAMAAALAGGVLATPGCGVAAGGDGGHTSGDNGGDVDPGLSDATLEATYAAESEGVDVFDADRTVEFRKVTLHNGGDEGCSLYKLPLNVRDGVTMDGWAYDAFSSIELRNASTNELIATGEPTSDMKVTYVFRSYAQDQYGSYIPMISLAGGASISLKVVGKLKASAVGCAIQLELNRDLLETEGASSRSPLTDAQLSLGAGKFGKLLIVRSKPSFASLDNDAALTPENPTIPAEDAGHVVPTTQAFTVTADAKGDVVLRSLVVQSSASGASIDALGLSERLANDTIVAVPASHAAIVPAGTTLTFTQALLVPAGQSRTFLVRPVLSGVQTGAVVAAKVVLGGGDAEPRTNNLDSGNVGITGWSDDPARLNAAFDPNNANEHVGYGLTLPPAARTVTYVLSYNG